MVFVITQYIREAGFNARLSLFLDIFIITNISYKYFIT